MPKRPTRRSPIVAIFGAPAAGKSYWREQIAQHLDWASLDIEDLGEVGSGRWPLLLDHLASQDAPAIVESIASPKPYRTMLRCCPSIVVHVRTPRSLRWTRLKEREPTPSRARELIAIAGRPPRRPDLRICTGIEPAVVLEAVDIALARAGVGGRGHLEGRKAICTGSPSAFSPRFP